MATPGKKARVHWTTEERTRFLAAARTMGYPKVGDTKEVWDRAQELAGLPLARRRAMEPATAAVMNAERKKASTAKPAPVAPVATAPAAPTPAPAPVAEDPTPASTPPAEDHPIAGLLADTILRVLYDDRIRKALRHLVTEALAPESELAQVEAVTWREAKMQREKLPRIVVAGGRSFLRDNLRTVHGVDLRLWGQVQGESPHRLYNLLRHADHCILVTSDIPHDVMYGVKSRAKRSGSPPLNIIYWTKPLSELPAAVQALAHKEE